MKKTFLPVLLIIFASTCLSNIHASGTLRLPQIFGDNMVIQRNENVAVWGWADNPECNLYNSK